MTRRAGKNGVVYMALTSAGTAEPVAFQSRWSINFKTNKIDVTSFGDPFKTYVQGLPDCTGMFSGFYDDLTVQTYTAASDGLPRKFYLYPDRINSPAQYFFGTILPDMTIESDVDGPITVSADWASAAIFAKVG